MYDRLARRPRFLRHAVNQPDLPAFRQTLFIATPAARVWNALITPAEVARYHLCPLQRLDLRPGGEIIYGVGDQRFIFGTVTNVVPERQLTHTFRFDAATHDGTHADAESRVSYTIVPMGAMCQLTLTHDQFGSDDQTYANITGGWPSILSGLKTWVETGKTLPWPTVT